MIILLIVGSIKKTLYKMSQYFPKPYEPFGGNINLKVDLTNYATKDNIKNITHVDTYNFALKTNLANLKTEVDKLDIDKLMAVPTDLSKLRDVVKIEVVKKTKYNKLVTEVDNIVTSDFVLKTKDNTDKTELENKTPDISGLASKILVEKVESEIPDISNLATTSALTVVENKIPSLSNLVKKTDYDTKIEEIENRMISLNKKVVSNKTKDKSIENKLKKLKTFYLIYFHGKNYFDEDGSQNYYIFQPISKHLKVSYVNDITYVLSWKSRGLNNVKIGSIKTNNYSLNPEMDHYEMSKIRAKFNGDIVNIYIVYEITSDYKDINYPALENCLFGSVELTKNADIDKYGYFGYGIGFDRQSSFSIGNETGKNVVIFGVDMSSSSKADNKKRHFNSW